MGRSGNLHEWLPIVSYQAGSEMVSSGGNYRLMGYAVSNSGDIEFPVLGQIHAAGLTRWELSEKIKSELIAQGMVQDPVVTVGVGFSEFMTSIAFWASVLLDVQKIINV